ncbi:alanine-phosphoribitol ligase [Actinoplanes sp. SE50]|uniref:styrene monooxygenase/indole monooxygenase family protein n=1 Tax=unclassified Actinoplanes TaxID=2626549 RepID=UPI00023ED319|nr:MULTISPECIES: styrene monooxygenase/indole monooxygenase family protein [unclassified Actinoplanes]AEV87835.1 putative oxygenase subunit protein [Actinoplanes sp. SE50/110]ATO86237.1 alanine-phosphoribitol ligase [Actinoplanes sp. SE50]SLM03652.1 alanine-phosphoribitol ligase [Actinoplanes sp. SE50/110]
MRKILIVGAGQAGLQLALSLHAEGYEVTLMSARTPDEIRTGWPTSTQAMFDLALGTERAYDLNHWEHVTPPIHGLRPQLSVERGRLALAFNAPLERPAQSTDQRIKMSRWLQDAEERGVEVIYNAVTTQDLDAITQLGRYDLTVVAAGKGDLVAMFDRDPERSPYSTPQRGLAVAYVHGLEPDPAWPDPHVGFHALPGLGELFVIPALTHTGPCDILFWEAIPGGPLDRWAGHPGRMAPDQHLAITLELAREHLPWLHARAEKVELTDAKATLHGRYTPTVRRPVGHLPGGGVALGLADVVIANDPITGQGSNTAAKAAHHYLQAILARGDEAFDEAWMNATFESFWGAHGAAVTGWTNAMLQPLPPHVQQLLGAATGSETIARRFAAGFNDPNDFLNWFVDPEKAAAYLAEVSGA